MALLIDFWRAGAKLNPYMKDLAPFRIGAVSGITAPLFYARPGSIICPRFTFSCLGTIPIHIWATLPFV